LLLIQPLFDDFTIYILYSERYNQIYVGYTSDLIARFRSHNKPGKGWTKKYRPWTAVYCEYLASKAEAMARELQLKGAAERAVIRIKLSNQFIELGYITGIQPSVG